MKNSENIFNIKEIKKIKSNLDRHNLYFNGMVFELRINPAFEGIVVKYVFISKMKCDDPTCITDHRVEKDVCTAYVPRVWWKFFTWGMEKRVLRAVKKLKAHHNLALALHSLSEQICKKLETMDI